MIANGIVAVGDICNTSDTLLQKQKGNLQYYNFIETFGVHENNIETILNASIDLRNQFRVAKMQSNYCPSCPLFYAP